MTVTKTLRVVLAAFFLASLVSATAAAQEPPTLPTELWQEYPLDPTAGEDPQPGAPQLTTTATRPVAPAAEPRIPVAQEEGSNLWVVLGITLGLAMLVGILAALVVIGVNTLLARSARLARGARLAHDRAHRRLTRARSTSARRRKTSARRVAEGLRSEVGSLAPFAEHSLRRPVSQSGRPVGPTKEATSPRRRTTPKARPKKLPKAGAPPPNKQLPGLSPPKKDDLIPSGLPPEKVLSAETRTARPNPVEQPKLPGPPLGKALVPETRAAARRRPSDAAGRPILRQDR